MTIVNDQFNSGGVPGHWDLYDGPYGSGAKNCASPSNVSVSGGSMHLVMRYSSGGDCGPGWYSGGMMVDHAHGGIDQRVTVRFRVVSAGVTAHRIIPMRWPTTDAWPAAGEEDLCEGSSLSACTLYLHFGASNSQIRQPLTVDLTAWHTFRFERRNHVLRVYIDNLTSPVWTYSGSEETLPSTFKRVVLQQECGPACPAGTSGSEDIQIDWITIENPAS